MSGLLFLWVNCHYQNLKEFAKKGGGSSFERTQVFEGSLKGVSRKIEGCFNEVLSGFLRSLKEVQWVFEGSFKGCFKEVLRAFQTRLRGVPRELSG